MKRLQFCRKATTKEQNRQLSIKRMLQFVKLHSQQDSESLCFHGKGHEDEQGLARSRKSRNMDKNKIQIRSYDTFIRLNSSFFSSKSYEEKLLLAFY